MDDDSPPAPPAADTPSKDAAKARDWWDKWESLAKIVGGIGIPLIGAFATWLISHESEATRKAQFELNLTQARETADTEIRAKMFEFLLARILARSEAREADSNPGRVVDDLETERTMLRLLVDNFPEHFASRGIFSRLYEKSRRAAANAGEADRQRLAELEQELLTVGRNARERQLASLPILFMSNEPIVVPLRRVIDLGAEVNALPPQSDSGRIVLYSAAEELSSVPDGINKLVFAQPVGDSEADRPGRYSIVIGVDAIRPDAAEVTVEVSRDEYEDRRYKESRRLLRYTMDASYFSTPIFDNTQLPDGARFALIYRGCIDLDVSDVTCRFPLDARHDVRAQFDFVVFRRDFQSRRDRPSPEALLKASTR